MVSAGRVIKVVADHIPGSGIVRRMYHSGDVHYAASSLWRAYRDGKKSFLLSDHACPSLVMAIRQRSGILKITMAHSFAYLGINPNFREILSHLAVRGLKEKTHTITVATLRPMLSDDQVIKMTRTGDTLTISISRVPKPKHKENKAPDPCYSEEEIPPSTYL